MCSNSNPELNICETISPTKEENYYELGQNHDDKMCNRHLHLDLKNVLQVLTNNYLGLHFRNIWIDKEIEFIKK